MKKEMILIMAAMSGAAVAQQLPDYPVVYSAELRGPVPNPAYHRAAPAQQSAARPATGAMGMQLAPAPRYTVDLTLGYGFMAVPDSKYATDVVTCELTGAYQLTPQHALTLSLGLAGGGETNDFWVTDGRNTYPFTDSYDRSSFTVMGGYRFTQPLARYVTLELGAKCGLDVQTLDVDYGYGWSGYPYYHRRGKSNTSAGMAYAGYAGLRFQVAKNAELLVGYQFQGSTAKPSARTGYPEQPPTRTGTMRWHEVRIGAAFRF